MENLIASGQLCLLTVAPIAWTPLQNFIKSILHKTCFAPLLSRIRTYLRTYHVGEPHLHMVYGAITPSDYQMMVTIQQDWCDLATALYV